MASATIIKECIKTIVTTYPLWTIGLTDQPEQREIEIGYLIGWQLFEADTEQVAKNVEAHFVGKGMKRDTGRRGTRAIYVVVFMGLKASPEGARPLQQAGTSVGLTTTKTIPENGRYLAQFETMYGDRPDYYFLQGVYAQVVMERDPDCVSVAELLTILYIRLESLGIEIADLAYNGTNTAPSALLKRKAYKPPLTS